MREGGDLCGSVVSMKKNYSLCVLSVSWLCATGSEVFCRCRVACFSRPAGARTDLFFFISFSVRSAAESPDASCFSSQHLLFIFLADFS
jgi:hypothetical protein